MNIEPRALLIPGFAALLMLLTLQQTSDALRQTGAFGSGRASATHEISPYIRLDAELQRGASMADAGRLRNPFAFVEAPAPSQPSRSAPRLASPPPAPEKPVLTAIIFDDDPRALIQYADRNYTVRASTLFADFTVRSITRDQVVLDQNGASLILKRPVGGP